MAKTTCRFAEPSVYGRAAAAALLLLPAALRANPVDGTVAAGAASISSSGDILTVTQTSNNAIINWGSFSIGAGELVRFLQPSADSAALNRVTGGDPSSIYGTLQANGRVFLINPNGVTVGAGGVINTQSFVASTLDLDDASFLAGGDLRFAGGSAAGIVNAGRIEALGGDVVLIARTVSNAGELSAPQGAVALAAGGEVLFQPGGNERVFVQAGSGEALGVGIDQRGRILAATAELKAAGGNVYSLAINNEGLVRAAGVRREGGRVYLVADGGDIALRDGSVIDAGGEDGGGTALVQGRNIRVERGAALKADALASGAGGSVSVLASEAVAFDGIISARGGAAGGDGGSAEVSGRLLGYRGSADLRAPAGAMGTLLLDPFDVTISHLAVNDASSIQDTVLTAQLQTANVTVATGDNGLPGGGDITILGGPDAANLTWTDGAGPSGTLTLNASRDIIVGFGSVIDSQGAGGIVFNANGGAGMISLKSDVTTNGGAQTYNGNVVVRKGDEYLTSHGGAIAFTGTVDAFAAGAQSLRIDSGGGDVAFAGGVGQALRLNELSVDALTGDIRLDGPAAASSLRLFGRDVVMGGDVATDGAAGVLMVASRSFQNPGSRAIDAAGGGRYLIYSVAPRFDAKGGLAGPSQYGTTYAGGPAPAFAGSGFLYSAAAPAPADAPAPIDRAVFSNDRDFNAGRLRFEGCRKKGKDDFECDKEGGAKDAEPTSDVFSWDLGTLQDAPAEPGGQGK